MNDENDGNITPTAVAPLGLVSGGPVGTDVRMARTTNGEAVVLLRLETTAGSWAQPISPELAVSLAKALQKVARECNAMTVARPTLLVPQ